MTTTTTTDVPSMTLEHLDPAALEIDTNVRLDPRLDAEFLASIAANGVHVPVDAIRTPDGRVLVQDGQRRTLAAVQGRRPTIPVLVTPGTAEGDVATVRRINRQVRINREREDLTAGEVIAAAETLFELKVPAGEVARNLGLTGEQVAAARKVAASKRATAAAAQYNLTIDQLAAIAEFDGSKETVAKLTEAAEQGSGAFAHALSRARLERDGKAAVAARARKLKRQGATVLTGSLDYRMWEKQLGNWAGPDGQQLTPETHAECPGRAVALRPGLGKNVTEVEETWYCTDPQANGHKKYRHRSPDTRTDAQREKDREELREIREGNRAWRAAEEVRRDWLQGFAQRPKPPTGALTYILEALASCTGDLVHAMTPGGSVRHEMARDLLGLPAGDGSAWSRPPEVLEALQHAPSAARAQQIALMLVLGAHEAATGVHTWKQGSEAAAAYLQVLAAWGYELSEIEQRVITKAAEDEARMAARRVGQDHHPDDDPDLPGDSHFGDPEDEPAGEPRDETDEAAGVWGPVTAPAAGTSASVHYLMSDVEAEPACKGDTGTATQAAADVNCCACLAWMNDNGVTGDATWGDSPEDDANGAA